MLALQRGDDDAFRRIVSHYGNRMLAFFRRYGADGATAEDLVQEAFLRIYRAKDRYEPTAKFSTWMHRIVHRIAMNEGTRNRWRRALPIHGNEEEEDGNTTFPPLETDEDTPFEQLDASEVREKVREAVHSLPENQRTALLLNRFEGLSYEDVAAVLGMKIPAVKSLLFRARENVRKRLTPLLHEEVRDETG